MKTWNQAACGEPCVLAMHIDNRICANPAAPEREGGGAAPGGRGKRSVEPPDRVGAADGGEAAIY